MAQAMASRGVGPTALVQSLGRSPPSLKRHLSHQHLVHVGLSPMAGTAQKCEFFCALSRLDSVMQGRLLVGDASASFHPLTDGPMTEVFYDEIAEISFPEGSRATMVVTTKSNALCFTSLFDRDRAASAIKHFWKGEAPLKRRAYVRQLSTPADAYLAARRTLVRSSSELDLKALDAVLPKDSPLGHVSKGEVLAPLDDACEQAVRKVITHNRRPSSETIETVETRPDGSVVVMTVTHFKRALTNAPCVGCRALAARSKCRWHLCGDCCRVNTKPCASHRNAPHAAQVEKEKKAARQRERERRGPCRYFMSGYCLSGDRCPYDHGADSSSRECDYHGSKSGLTKTLRAVAASSVGRADVNAGDKSILPQSVLMEALHKDLAYPMAFRVKAMNANDAPLDPIVGALAPAVHVGVLDFTAEEGAVYLPDSAMASLGVSDGDSVTISYVSLPKGVFVRLQPQSHEWLSIPEDERHTLLELGMGHYQTLTAGTTLSVDYNGHRHTLSVLECRPQAAVSIIDTDITTDVTEPANCTPDLLPGVLVPGRPPVNGACEEGAYARFVIPSLSRGSAGVTIRVQPISGDPDVYVSQAVARPSRSCYVWCAQEPGASVLSIAADSPLHQEGRALYVAVGAIKGETMFTISVEEYSPSSGHEASSSAAADGASAGGATDPECGNCGRRIPALTMVMHERNCRRFTHRCADCGTCVAASAAEKHRLVHHGAALECDWCGERLSQLALHDHQSMDAGASSSSGTASGSTAGVSACPRRPVRCGMPYCNLSVARHAVEEHRRMCAERNVACHLCGDGVRRGDFGYHLEAMHNIDAAAIDWLRPIDAQELKPLSGAPASVLIGDALAPSAPSNGSSSPPAHSNSSRRHTCRCGAAFDARDDYEVHTLTDCPHRIDLEEGAANDVSGSDDDSLLSADEDVDGALESMEVDETELFM